VIVRFVMAKTWQNHHPTRTPEGLRAEITFIKDFESEQSIRARRWHDTGSIVNSDALAADPRGAQLVESS
jgi:hypothetical protein